MFVTADVYHKTSSSIAFLVRNTMDPILRQLNPVEKIKHCFLRSILILRSQIRLVSVGFTSGFPTCYNFLITSHFSMRAIWLSEFQLSSFGHLNVIIIRSMSLSPSSCILPCLKWKYSPQHFVHRYLEIN